MGLGFDATCSTVFLDKNGNPTSASTTGELKRNTIAWFDHRAIQEAEEITQTHHKVLNYSGGVMSVYPSSPHAVESMA